MSDKQISEKYPNNLINNTLSTIQDKEEIERKIWNYL